MAHEIFICYRRRDTGGYAGRLYDHLHREFGGRVLLDVEVEGTAEILREWVLRVVPHCAVVLVLIGREWLMDCEERRRLEEPDDIVRLEIDLAITNGVPLVPILVETATFPDPADLPESIRSLASFKGYELGNGQWTAKLNSIVEATTERARTHLIIVGRGFDAWHAWRVANPETRPVLSHADLAGADLRGWDLTQADLTSTDLRGACLAEADLSEADLTDADLRRADLSNARLRLARLARADLSEAGLARVDFKQADLRHANLNEADLNGTLLHDCQVYGVSTWNARLEDADQRNLLLSRGEDEAPITVDSIQIAVILHLLLTAGGVRETLDVLTGKLVLVLGRFAVAPGLLNSLVQELRRLDLLPILFDFAKPAYRDMTETVSVLAHLSRFVVADLGDVGAMSVLGGLVPRLPSVPVVPLLPERDAAPTIWGQLDPYPWVIEPLAYAPGLDPEQVQALALNVADVAERARERSGRERLR